MGCCQINKFDKGELVEIQNRVEELNYEYKNSKEDEFDDISLSSVNNSHIYTKSQEKGPSHKRSLSTLSGKSLRTSLNRGDFENAFLVLTPTSLYSSIVDSESTGPKDFVKN